MTTMVGLLVVGAGLLWICSGTMEASAARLAEHYRLPPVVSGAVVVAVGSSFPELATAVMSPLLHDSFELGLASIIGSAIFNILVLPGISSLQVRGGLPVSRDLVFKESLFYMLSIAVLLITVSLAVIYRPVQGLTGTLDRGLALVPLALYGMYIFVQAQDTWDHQAASAPADDGPIAATWLWLVGSLAGILIGVEALIRSVLAFGDAWGVPDFFWGVTVVAAVTSVPDLFVSVRAAQRGRSIESVANAIGSNVFDLLVCVPAGVLVAGAATVDFALAAPLMSALTFATVVLFVCMRGGMRLSRANGALLVTTYVAFVAWMVMEAVGTVQLLPSG